MFLSLNLSILAALVHLGGLFSSIICLALWLLYFSVVTSADGTAWYSYGWESQ